MCVCVCVRERERDRDRKRGSAYTVHVCVCASLAKFQTMCALWNVCVCECVCVRNCGQRVVRLFKSCKSGCQDYNKNHLQFFPLADAFIYTHQYTTHIQEPYLSKSSYLCRINKIPHCYIMYTMRAD